MNNAEERTAAGIAVTAAVLSGACGRCPYFAECASDSSYNIPADAWCSKKKESYARQLRDKQRMAHTGTGNSRHTTV